MTVVFNKPKEDKMRRFNLKDSHGNLHFIEAEIIEFDDIGSVTFLSSDNADALIACFARGAWSAVFLISEQPTDG